MRTLFVLGLLACCAPALAQGTVAVTTAESAGPGSLAAAVAEANATAGPQTIVFQIPLADPGFFEGKFLIQTLEFPSLTLTDDGTTIDGTTQTAFTGDTNPSGPEVYIVGNAPPNYELRGFVVQSNDNVIRGLFVGGEDVFNIFRFGIEITGNRNVVEGCRFQVNVSAHIAVSGDGNRIGGTAPGAGNAMVGSGGVGVWLRADGLGNVPDGNVVQGNLIAGQSSGAVSVEGTGNVIGGADPAARNVLASNGRLDSERRPVGSHVSLGGSGNEVRGNWIGLNTTGAASPGFARTGVDVSGTGNAVTGNVIGGFAFNRGFVGRAVRVTGGAGHTVRGNLIGLDPTGQMPRPNAVGVEVLLSGTIVPGAVTVGGLVPGEGNTIAYSERTGVQVSGATSAAVLGNSLFANGTPEAGGGGIDLALSSSGDGPTPNDPGDADEGPNRFQNTPEIALAALAPDGLAVTYTVDTAPANATYDDGQGEPGLIVEFFAADGGQGRTLVARDRFTAADYAAGGRTATLPLLAPPGLGSRLVATATDEAGNTSEFSAATGAIGAVAAEAGVPAEALGLSAAPNPASARAAVTVTLGAPQTVAVAVYDALGRRVAVLHDGPLGTGAHVFAVDAAALPAGVYVVRATAGGGTAGGGTAGGGTASRRLVVAR